jgi:hypothetical protein
MSEIPERRYVRGTTGTKGDHGKECHGNGRWAQKDTKLVERCRRRTLESSVQLVRAVEMAGDGGGKDRYGSAAGQEAAVGWASHAAARLGSVRWRPEQAEERSVWWTDGRR